MESIPDAVIGFLLGQLINVVTFLHGKWAKPRLCISRLGANHIILDHYPETSPYEGDVREVRFGFRVSNRGRRVARGVRAYVTKVEGQGRGDTQYKELISHSYALSWAGIENRSLDPQTILPGATLNVLLAAWREDHDFVAPEVRGPDSYYKLEAYYEEACADVMQYRFSVVAVDERGDFVSTTLDIEKPRAPRVT